MDQKNTGPTVFDINKPNTYGAAPSGRPVIVGHRPTMPDPMVTAQPSAAGSKIKVKIDEPPEPPAVMQGEPQLSPPFKPDGGLAASDDGSAAQQAPYMAVSDLTGITQDQASRFVKNTKASEISDEQVDTTNPKPSVFGSSNHGLVNDGGPSKRRKPRAKSWLLPLLILFVLSGAYLAIDKGLILSSINLPVHIFKKTVPAATTPQSANPSTQVTVPSGFTSTKLVEAKLTFAYPTVWGAPTAATDQGFSKRTKDGKADTPHAYVITFPNNKDVELTVTSSKILSPRAVAQYVYYDFLGWCVGTVDSNYYAAALNFVTENNIDTPSTVACNIGPLSSVTKLDNDTIVQANIKNADGKTLVGDIYTKNLTNTNFMAAHVRDATMKNAELIKTMLGTIQNL